MKIVTNYYIDKHKLLTDVLPIIYIMKYKIFIFNRETSRWTSYAKKIKVGQALKENSRLRKYLFKSISTK